MSTSASPRGGRRCLAAVVLVLACIAGGCASSAGSLLYTSSLVESQLGPSRLEPDEYLRLGPVRMSLLRGLVRVLGDEVDPEARAILSDTKRLEVASYQIEPGLDGSVAIDLGDLERELSVRGWSRMVMERDDGELTLVMVREDGRGRMRGMYVVSIDHGELEMVRIEGTLDRAIAMAMAEDTGAVIEAAGSGSRTPAS